jgi:hypothetical protein
VYLHFGHGIVAHLGKVWHASAMPGLNPIEEKYYEISID